MEQNVEMTLIEAIRKRPAMYIGSTSVRGFNNILHELIKDFFEATEANYFSFELLGGYKGKFTFKNIRKAISDNVGIDIWRREEKCQGFELASLNALSKYFELGVFDKNNIELFHQVFEKGEIKKGKITDQKYKADRIEITFDLDDSILELTTPLNTTSFFEQLRNLAYLHKGNTLAVIYPVDDEICKAVFKFENGMKDRIEVEKLKGWGGTYFDTYLETKFEDFTFEAAFCFRETPVNESFLISFVNCIHTRENGTHVRAFLNGITEAINQYILNHKLTDRYSISERAILEVLVAAIHIKMKTPLFYGAVKNKLASPKIILPISKHISELFLHKMEGDKKWSEHLLQKSQQFI